MLLPGLDDVADDVDRAEDGAADAAGEADDLARAVADGRDAVQRALDPGAVVVAERADALDDVLDVPLGHLAVEEATSPVGEARLRPPAEVHHHLEQVGPIAELAQPIADLRRQRLHQRVEVVGRSRGVSR